MLVNLRGLRQDPQEQIYDQEYPKARLKYFTPLTTALSYDTIGEYCDHNAMLRVWSAYCAMAIVRIPKGSRVVFLLGLAAPQRADQRMLERDAQSLGVDPSFFQHFSPGGGVQLLVIEAPGSTVFDLGSLFKDTGERFISRLGDPGEPQLYLDPIKHFLDEARLKNLHCHLLYKGWVQQLLRFRNFLGLARRIR